MSNPPLPWRARKMVPGNQAAKKSRVQSNTALAQLNGGGPEPPYPPAAYSWYVVGVLMVVYVFSFMDRLGSVQPRSMHSGRTMSRQPLMAAARMASSARSRLAAGFAPSTSICAMPIRQLAIVISRAYLYRMKRKPIWGLVTIVTCCHGDSQRRPHCHRGHPAPRSGNLMPS